MGGTLVLVDLDDTLFQSTHGTWPAARSRKGPMHSFMRDDQRRLLGQLRELGTVAAVTGRTPGAWARLVVELGGPAVLAHGACLLGEDGLLDEAWGRRVQAELADHDVEALAAAVEGLTELVPRITRHEGLALAVHLRHPHRDAAATAAALPTLQAALPPGWTAERALHRVDLLPPPVRKERGAAELIRRLEPELVLGLGDAAANLSFLELCHFVAMPRDSELFASLLRSPP